jgi:hypothetical protein
MQHSLYYFTNKFLRFTLFGFLLLGTACTPATPTPALEPIQVQYSFAAQPWLVNLNKCAGKNVLAVELRAAVFQDLRSVNLILRVGQPDNISTPAYQIGTDDLLVIVNNKNPINQLTVDQARALFNGQIQNWKAINGTDAPVQVWVYPMGEDVQQFFEQSVLGGIPVTSLAQLANSPEEMSQAVLNNIDAVGIITRHWKTRNTSDVFTAASNLPVLAITQSEPQGALAQTLACLQK